MLIVGLGNPGNTYEKTYHNIGFMVIDSLAKRLSLRFKDKECKAEIATAFIGGEKIILAKPQTFMNLSGESVKELIAKHKQSNDDILIIFDDIDINIGDIRIRKEGSGGTHNGMKNIIEVLKCKDIPRMRIGVGKPSANIPLADYVLSQLRGENKEILEKSIERAVDGLFEFVSHRDLDKLMRNMSAPN